MHACVCVCVCVCVGKMNSIKFDLVHIFHCESHLCDAFDYYLHKLIYDAFDYYLHKLI